MILPTFCFIFMFTREFLETARLHPGLDKMILLMVAGLLSCLVATPFIDLNTADRAGLLMSTVLVPVLFLMATYAMVQRNRNTQFFLFAWSFNLTGGSIFIAMCLGSLPSTVAVRTAFPAGVLIEALLLSFSLADKIKYVQEEVEKANHRTLRMTRRYGKVLEAKVDERTQHLISTQRQLVTKQKMAALGVLTGGVANEIHEPNANIVAGVDQLVRWQRDFKAMLDELMGEDTDPEIRQMFQQRFRRFSEQLDVIQTGGSRINTIVSGLRTITRLDDAERHLVDIVARLQQTLELIRPTVGEDIEFVAEVRDRPLVHCTPTDLTNAFMGIINNAVQAVRDRQKVAHERYQPRIRLSSRVLRTARGEELFLSIEDNGVGMEKEVAEQAFDPFFTTREVGAGAGLGLSTTRETIEKHGGHISLASVPGEGTSVIVMLPVGVR